MSDDPFPPWRRAMNLLVSLMAIAAGAAFWIWVGWLVWQAVT